MLRECVGGSCARGGAWGMLRECVGGSCARGDAWGMLRECVDGSCARGDAWGNDDVRDEAAMARDKQENEFSLEFNM